MKSQSRTKPWNIVAEQVKMEMTDVHQFPASSLIRRQDSFIRSWPENPGIGFQDPSARMYPIAGQKPHQIIGTISVLILTQGMRRPVVKGKERDRSIILRWFFRNRNDKCSNPYYIMMTEKIIICLSLFFFWQIIEMLAHGAESIALIQINSFQKFLMGDGQSAVCSVRYPNSFQTQFFL